MGNTAQGNTARNTRGAHGASRHITLPFYANSRDDTRCLQASLRMVLAHFHPHRTYSRKELDTITGHQKGLWTYPYRMYLWLAEEGFRVAHVEGFSVKRFAREGERYLKELWDERVYRIQKKFSDFSAAQKDARAALESEKIAFRNMRGTIKVAKRYFLNGWMVLLRVNPYLLRGARGLGSHVVVLTGVGRGAVTLHDPGLPPQKNLRVTNARMKKALYGDNSLVIAIKPAAAS